jgi:hypothetical protein
MSMIRRVMIEVYSIKVIMKSRKSWFKTMAEVREVQSATGEELSTLLPSVLDRAFKGVLYSYGSKYGRK